MTSLSTDNLSIEINRRLICHNLSLHFQAGEVIGVIGANGAGKTTFLHTLAGLHPVAQGRLLLNKQPLTAFSNKQLAKQLGLLFQTTSTGLPQTVFDYCLAARFPHRSLLQSNKQQDIEIVMQSLEQMALTSHARQSIQQLSGGEKRRLAMAALLTQAPAVYLLDEPTNHLDPYHQRQLLSCVRTLAKEGDALVIMVLHDLSVVKEYCDRVVMLFQQGKCLVGNTQELLDRNLGLLYGPVETV